MANNTAIGMMNASYFVGRKAILAWVNEVCDTNLTKVEQTCTGAIACQVMDCIFPGKVAMHKVNWGAKADYEYVTNYKVLQAVCNKMSIDRKVEVDRLIRGKYQDNLEFMQWLKSFMELNFSGDVNEYDAVGRRARGKNVAAWERKYSGSGRTGEGNAAPVPASRKPVRKPVAAKTRPPKAPAAAPASTRTARTRSPPRKTKEPVAAKARSPVRGSAPSAALKAKVASLEKANEELKKNNGGLLKRANDAEAQIVQMTATTEELHVTADGLERERDFYFSKLREVEILLQDYEGGEGDMKEKVLEILYATADDEDDAEGSGDAQQDPTTSDDAEEEDAAPAEDEAEAEAEAEADVDANEDEQQEF